MSTIIQEYSYIMYYNIILAQLVVKYSNIIHLISSFIFIISEDRGGPLVGASDYFPLAKKRQRSKLFLSFVCISRFDVYLFMRSALIGSTSLHAEL